MADEHDLPPKPSRAAPPPFAGPPRTGALAPKTRADRPTLPPFSPPFVKRPSPGVPVVREEEGRRTSAAPPRASDPGVPSWLDEEPNEAAPATPAAPEMSVGWVNPDQPAVPAPPQAATGIEWLDSPPETAASAVRSQPSPDEVDDVFGWDPAEERAGALDAPPAATTLDALKELEPWALPGVEPSASTAEDIAAALERVAARIRSGDVLVPGASTLPTDEAALAAALTALLQRAPG